MTFIVTFLVVVTACFALRNAIRKVPTLFYVLSIAFTVLYLASFSMAIPRGMRNMLILTMGHCYLPVAMFALVMFIGVMPFQSQIRRWLQPVRGPLSIMACFLVLGHMVQYFMVYKAKRCRRATPPAVARGCNFRGALCRGHLRDAV